MNNAHGLGLGAEEENPTSVTKKVNDNVLFLNIEAVQIFTNQF